jgi:hypothetical protein
MWVRVRVRVRVRVQERVRVRVADSMLRCSAFREEQAARARQ